MSAVSLVFFECLWYSSGLAINRAVVVQNVHAAINVCYVRSPPLALLDWLFHVGFCSYVVLALSCSPWSRQVPFSRGEAMRVDNAPPVFLVELEGFLLLLL